MISWMMFEELDIMVIDEASKEEIQKSRKLKKRQERTVEKEELQGGTFRRSYKGF